MSDNRSVTAVGARKAIKKCFAKQRPLFLWGPPGIGDRKSTRLNSSH